MKVLDNFCKENWFPGIFISVIVKPFLYSTSCLSYEPPIQRIFAYTIWAVRFLDLPIYDTRHFPTKKLYFIDENMGFFYVRHYLKQTRYFSYVMIIATTFTVCLAYRHYRNTRLVQFLVIAYMYVLRFFFFFVFFFFFRIVVVFFLLQRIAIIFDDAIYLFIYFLHFKSMLLRPSPILKTIQKMGERNEKNNNFTTANK